jgi:hypothetical protein
MSKALFRHLWCSAGVRRALASEALRLLIYVATYFLAVVSSRYFRDKPLVDDPLEILLQVMIIGSVWLLAIIRTVRAVLRAEGLLTY